MSGRSRSGSIPAGAKPIPGTTLTLPPHPTAPGHPARSRSLSGPSYPPLPQAGEATADHGGEPAAHDAAAAEDKDRAAKAKFFLEDASSAGSRTSSESGYSEHRATSSSNAGSYAEACKKAAAVAAVPAAAAAGGTGAGDTGLGSRGGGGGRGSQAQSGGKYAQLGGARIGGRGEERWSGGRDREFARREQARPDGRYTGRGGRGNFHPRGRGGDFDSNNRGENYDGRGGNYGWGRSRGRYYQHADQQYSRQGSRQSRSEPQFSGQEPNDNRNLRRTVSDRPPDTGDR